MNASTTSVTTAAGRARRRWLTARARQRCAFWPRLRRLLGSHAALPSIDGRCLCERQRRANHAADLGHRGRHRRRRHAVRAGRSSRWCVLDQADAKVALDRGGSRSSPRPCVKCATCMPPPRSCKRWWTFAARIWRWPSRISRGASGSAAPARFQARNCSTPAIPRAAPPPPCFPPSSSCGPAARAPMARTSRITPTCATPPRRCAAPISTYSRTDPAGTARRLRRQAQRAARSAREPGPRADGRRAAR